VYSILAEESDDFDGTRTGRRELSRVAATMGLCRNAVYAAKQELVGMGVLKWGANGEYWIGPLSGPPIPNSWHFFPLPKAMLASRELNLSDKVVYGGLAYHGPLAYPAVETLARETSLSEATVHRSLRTLQVMGLIQLSSDPAVKRRSNVYQFPYHELAELWTPVDFLREEMLGRPFQDLVDLMRGELRLFTPEEIVEFFNDKLMAHLRKEISPLCAYDVSKLAPKQPAKAVLLGLPNFELVGHIAPKLWNRVHHLITPDPAAPAEVAWKCPKAV